MLNTVLCMQAPNQTKSPEATWRLGVLKDIKRTFDDKMLFKWKDNQSEFVCT